jgi:predicted permease
VSLVLFIACGNVANLLQARGAARSQELAIRAAIGAGRGRLVRMLLTENLVLSLIGGGLGVAIAAGLTRVLVAAAPRDAIPRLGETRIDAVVLGFALGVVLVATVVSGLMPALRAARRDLQATLRAGGLGAGTRAARDRLRNGLIAGEVALALTLLAGAGLLVRSAINLQRLPTGLDLDGVTAARVALPTAAYGEPDRVVRSFERLVEALRAHPAVEHAAVVSVPPLAGLGSTNGLVPEGRPAGPESAINSALRLVTSDYFRTVRLPLRRGRPFTDQDDAGGLRVMVVSERLAAMAWPGEDPVGKRILCCEGSRDDPRWKTVVGVVGDVRSRGGDRA